MTDLFLKNLNETFDKAVEGRISQIKIDENFDRLSLEDMMIYSAPGRDIGYICIPGLDFVSSQIDLFFLGYWLCCVARRCFLLQKDLLSCGLDIGNGSDCDIKSVIFHCATSKRRVPVSIKLHVSNFLSPLRPFHIESINLPVAGILTRPISGENLPNVSLSRIENRSVAYVNAGAHSLFAMGAVLMSFAVQIDAEQIVFEQDCMNGGVGRLSYEMSFVNANSFLGESIMMQDRGGVF